MPRPVSATVGRGGISRHWNALRTRERRNQSSRTLVDCLLATGEAWHHATDEHRFLLGTRSY